MPNIRGTSLLWGLICALALVVGLIAGRMGLAGHSNALSLANFKPDFPFTEIRGKTFKNETVQLDGNAFIDCTFDNVTLKFDGQAPFRFTNDHFENRSKLQITSSNPVIKSTIELIGVFLQLQNPAQNQLKENK
jgi:hypothetical protein